MKSILFIIMLIIFSTCKKYPDGGLVNQTRKHLFGGNDVGDSKTWKLKLYEVNGIDSTYLIQGANSIPDFYEKFVTFTYEGKSESIEYRASTFLCDYSGAIGTADKQILLTISHRPLLKEDSAQCKTVDNTQYCGRNLLYPEFNNSNKIWDIRTLTKNECTLESTFKLKNSFRLILTN